MIVCAFDPGSNHIGCAFLKGSGTKISILKSYQIALIGNTLERRLFYLLRKTDELLSTNEFDELAIEHVFVSTKGTRSPLVIAKSKGVIMSIAGKFNKTFHEYNNKTVKKTVCGNGGISIEKLNSHINEMFGGHFGEDEASSIAIGICHLMKSF